MRQKRLGGLFAAAVFLLCAVMTGTYLIAGYGAYLDSDMASELALASHLAEEGKLISGTWVYSTEVRVLSTQLIFTPLMALFPHDWRLVRTFGCLILQGILAASAYFCGRALGADKKFSLLFAGLSISACSVVYAQMVTIGAYYVPHAVLTNLCVGMTARLMRMEKGKKRAVLGALLLAMCARTMLTLAVCAVSVAGFAVGQRILSRVCLYDAARYGGVRLASFLDADMPGTIQQALGGLARLMGYSERCVLLSAHGLVSVGALLLPAAAAVLLARTLKAARENQSDVLRFGAYLNRYWIPLMTLGAPVMAACLTGETNAPLRRGCALLFAGVVLTASAMQITSTMKHPEITDVQRERAAFLQESGLYHRAEREGAGRAARQRMAGGAGKQADGAAGRAGVHAADGGGERAARRLPKKKRGAGTLHAGRNDRLRNRKPADFL